MRELLVIIIAAIILSIVAKILDKPGRRLVKSIINSKLVTRSVYKYYIKKAEKKFPGRKRGAEKKAWVKEKAEQWHIEVCKDADEVIDSIVRFMNLKSGKLSGQIEEKASVAVDELIQKTSRGDKDENNGN